MRRLLALLLFLPGLAYAYEARAQQDGPAVGVVMAGVWDRAMPLIERASRETGIDVTSVQIADLLGDDGGALLARTRVLYLLNISADQVELLRKKLQEAAEANPGLLIVPLDQRDSHAVLHSAELMHEDPAVRAYWRSNGLQNMRRLLVYTSVTYLGGESEVQPPSQVPDSGYYLPERPEEAVLDFADVQAAASWKPDAPRAVILIHQSFWITQDTKVIDAQIAALRARGYNAVALFANGDGKLFEMLRAMEPDLLIEDRHAGTWETAEGKHFLRELDVPYLRPISMLGYTTEQWLADPRGLHIRDVNNFLSLQEMNGTVDPIVIGGLTAGISGFRLHEPIPERIDRFADRAVRWHALRATSTNDKRVAIVYYSKSLGQDDLMRGSPTGAFLDGPESLVRFLPRLAEAGYTMPQPPATAPELLEQVRSHGRNIGPWAQGQLDELADHADVELIPLADYERWFNTLLDEKHRQEVIARHGPPPGRLMVVQRNEKPYLVIPVVRLGNVILTPQPERAEKQDEALLHARDVPPPHSYLAFYWWLQHGFKADAVVHWGTHGSLELQPGKEAGLSAGDWSDICTGTLPIVNLWIMDNLGESMLSRRRSYALLVDHLVPPAVTVAAANETLKLHEDLGKFVSLEDGLLRQEYRKLISQRAVQQRFVEALGLRLDEQGMLEDAAIDKLHGHLHVVTESKAPTSLHILGQQVDREKVPDYLTSILGEPLLSRVATESATGPGPADEHTHDDQDTRGRAVQILRSVLIDGAPVPAGYEDEIAQARAILGRLDQTDDEITNLLHALEGGFVEPGPGPDAIRNPASLPPGRNLYTLNPEEIPTRAAWNVGVRLVNQLLVEHAPKKIGIDLNGMNTMRDFGVMEAQVLYLMGVRPVWDANRLAVDVELIPSEELGRPRVDVFIAMGGQYKENFPSRVKLIDKAIQLVSELDEPENLVREGTLANENKLLEAGYSAERAAMLARARIFGTKPGNLSGTNILYLVPRSGVWDDDSEITSIYIDSMSYAYVGEIWGEKLDGLYEQAIQGTDTLLRVWASNMTSQLSNHHSYEYLGGLNMAVKQLTGKEPMALIADVRDPNTVRIRSFEEVLDTTLRSELLNEDWISGMKGHDYAGAGHMAELVKNTFGWDVTRDSAISDAVWNDIYATYIEDARDLSLEEWFDKVNPHAMQEIMATMMEAARKGYWSASDEQLDNLAKRYAESVVEHGPSAGLVSGGNEKFDHALIARLGKIDEPAMADAYSKAIAKSAGDRAGQVKVFGAKMTPQSGQGHADGSEGDVIDNRMLLIAGGVLLLLVGFGAWRRVGAAR